MGKSDLVQLIKLLLASQTTIRPRSSSVGRPHIIQSLANMQFCFSFTTSDPQIKSTMSIAQGKKGELASFWTSFLSSSLSVFLLSSTSLSSNLGNSSLWLRRCFITELSWWYHTTEEKLNVISLEKRSKSAILA